MIIEAVVDICKIQAWQTPVFEDSQIGIIGHSLVNLIRKRIRHGIGRCLRELPNKPAVFIGRFRVITFRPLFLESPVKQAFLTTDIFNEYTGRRFCLFISPLVVVLVTFYREN